ncbi:MAG: hypothetical protein CL669_04405 [Balneola sp.]|nr:hypothetical protein [Balneola sp.]
MDSTAIYSLRDSMKTTVNKMAFTTGSPILDALVSTLIFVLINEWFNIGIRKIEELKAYLLEHAKSMASGVFGSNAQVVLVGKRIRNTKYGGSDMQYSDRYLAVTNYILDQLPHLKKVSGLKESRMRSLAKDGHFGSEVFILDTRRPVQLSENIFVVYEEEKDNRDKDDKSQSSESVTITKITLSSNKLTVQEITEFVSKITEAFLTKRNLESADKQFYFEFDSLDEEGQPIFTEKELTTKKTFDSVFFKQKDELLEKYDFFLSNEEWYNKRGIPWHFGVLLSGEPGTGKTSIIKSLVNYRKWKVGKMFNSNDYKGQLDHIISVPLSRVNSCAALSKIFFNERINRHHVPMSSRIYLMEDIDAQPSCSLRQKDCLSDSSSDKSSISSYDDLSNCNVSNDLQTSKIISALKKDTTSVPNLNNDPLTLAYLLNLTDGLCEMSGRRLIYTTNHRDKLDPALIRPGRIDLDLVLEKATAEDTRNMVESFYGDKCRSVIRDKVFPEKTLTGAQINNILYLHTTNCEKGVDAILERKIKN